MRFHVTENRAATSPTYSVSSMSGGTIVNDEKYRVRRCSGKLPRRWRSALRSSLPVFGSASAQYATQAAYNNGSNMGGGFIEFLFGGPPQQMSPYHQPHQPPQYAPQPVSAAAVPAARISGSRCIRRSASRATRRLCPTSAQVDPKFAKQMVAYSGRETRRHHRHRYAEQVSLSRAGRRPGAALRHRRRPAGIHLVRREDRSR